MKTTYILTTVLCAIYLPIANAANSTSPDDTDGEYDSTFPYCFRFTWLGPAFDNSSNVNTTCAEIKDETRAVGVPCREPLLITFDGTPPDIDNLWSNYRDRVICRRSRGQVCAKYSYIFNNEVQNVTYMCTKVMEDGGAITGGSYKQDLNGYQVELDICESRTGPYKPCNGATTTTLSLGLLMSVLYVIHWR